MIAPLLAAWLMRFVEYFWLPRNRVPGTVRARWTMGLLGGGYAVVVACSIAEFVLLRRVPPPGVLLLGWGVILLRIPVKFWAAGSLQRYWSPHIEIREDHRLVMTGPYRYLRHPVYCAAILDLVAVPLVTGAWYTLMAVSPWLLAAIVWRMRLEESALIEKFGAQYEAYRRETFALLPVRKAFLAGLLRGRRAVATTDEGGR
jgi:protein-S-isoprenylcysteine O-methyltransferase Ste14